jgi:hypothetical protein
MKEEIKKNIKIQLLKEKFEKKNNK